MQPPRYLSLYKRLFGGGAGFWASTSGASPNMHGSGQHSEMRMDSLTGCPDEALLAIAEISALAHWKASELQSGSLSVRELIRRGDIIEKELREGPMGKRPEEEDFKPPMGSMDMPAGLPMALGGQSGMQMSSPGMSGMPRSRSPVNTNKQIIGEMFREAAVLYLHTVLSESAPGMKHSPSCLHLSDFTHIPLSLLSLIGVPEIVNSVDQMLKLLNELTPSSYDRTLVFPLFLTGCMTETQMVREVIKHRFFMQDATMGNILLAQTVMENLWAHRTAVMRATPLGEHPVFGDWRQCLRMQWASLVLV